MKLAKKWAISLFATLGAVVIAGLILIILTCTVWKVDVKVSAEQIGQTQEIEVSWEVSKSVRKVEITVSHNGRKLNSTTLYDQDQIMSGSYDVGGGFTDILM